MQDSKRLMAYIAQPAHLQVGFRDAFRTIPRHVREGRASNAKQHLWLELSIRPGEINVLTMEALFCLSLLEDSRIPTPHRGFVPEPFLLLRKHTPTDGAWFFQNKSCDAAGNCGGSIGQVQTRKKKKHTHNRTKKNRAKKNRSGVWWESGLGVQ